MVTLAGMEEDDETFDGAEAVPAALEVKVQLLKAHIVGTDRSS